MIIIFWEEDIWSVISAKEDFLPIILGDIAEKYNDCDPCLMKKR